MNENKAKLSRRNFLLAVGVGGAAGAAAIVAKTAPQPQAAAPGEDRRGTKGYQASTHVRNYYRTAKI